MRFWKREDNVEHELRALRREPRPEFLRSVESKIHGDRYRRPTRSLRLGLAGALTAGALAALAAFGGLGYAASGVTHAVHSAVHAVAPTKNATPNGALSSAAVQYHEAFCLRGHTIFADSHAAKGLMRAGARPGPCTGTAAPAGSRKFVFVCFQKQSIKVEKRSVPAMLSVGAKKGKCKKK